MGWIYKDEYLSQSEMENNANIIINNYRLQDIPDDVIASLLGNIQRESTIQPILNERGGGGGYGLIQWTPKSHLQNNCNSLGISPVSDGDVQLEVIRKEIVPDYGINTWYTTSAFVTPYYPSGATPAMIGVKGSEFLSNSKGFSLDELTILYMVGRERPSRDPEINAIAQRIENTRFWYDFMGGIVPPTPTKNKKMKLMYYMRRF